MLDQDEAGQKGTEDILRRLFPHAYVKVIQLTAARVRVPGSFANQLCHCEEA